MVAHTADVTSAVLKNIHGSYLIASRLLLLLLRWSVSAARKRLVIKPQICDFWEQALLSTHRKLLVSKHGILLQVRLIFNSRWMISMYLVLLSGTIIPLDVTLCFVLSADKQSDLLLLVLPTLSSYAMIILLMTLNTIWLRLDRVALHIGCCSIRVWAVTVTLPPRRIWHLFLLLHQLIVVNIHGVLKWPQSGSTPLHRLAETVVLENSSCCLVANSVLSVTQCLNLI